MNQDARAGQRGKAPCRIGDLALSCAAFGLLLAGCSGSSTNIPKISSDTRMTIADIAAQGGDPETARTILAAAAQADPNNSELQLRYGEALLVTGRPDDAIGVAEQAAERAKDDPKIAVKAAQLELRAGDPRLAAVSFMALVARNQGGTQALNGLGVAQVQLNDMAAAEAAFRRAIVLSPGDYAARNNLALLLVLQGRADEAVPMLQSLADEPGVPERVRHNLALAYVAQGDARQAAAVLSGVVSTAQASRELAAYGAVHAGAPTEMASRLAPVEVLQGRTTAPAYAAMPPPPVPVATAAASQPDAATIGDLRTAPVATVQATPIAPPAPTQVASAAPPVPAPAAPAPRQAANALLANVITPTGTGNVVPVSAAAPPSAALSAAIATATVAITEPADDGTIKVRIAAVPSESAALLLWNDLARRAPDLLGKRTPMVHAASEHGQKTWRLGTGGFRTVADAEEFCRALRERGPTCKVGL